MTSLDIISFWPLNNDLTNYYLMVAFVSVTSSSYVKLLYVRPLFVFILNNFNIAENRVKLVHPLYNDVSLSLQKNIINMGFPKRRFSNITYHIL